MTSTSIPAAATPVRLHDHWRDPARVEADELTLRRAAKALIAAGYSVTAAPCGVDTERGGHDLWCAELDARSLRRVLIEAGIPAVIATVTRFRPPPRRQRPKPRGRRRRPGWRRRQRPPWRHSAASRPRILGPPSSAGSPDNPGSTQQQPTP